jgi:twitching motility protein PilT
MRDRETISLALTAAETGHLVFGTLHTSSAPKTIDRIIDVFPAGEKADGALDAVRVAAGGDLAGAAQKERRRPNGGHEIMVGVPAIRNLIREDKVAQMYSSIQTGAAFGMQTLDQCLLDLVKKGTVAREEALNYAQNKASFKQQM